MMRYVQRWTCAVFLVALLAGGTSAYAETTFGAGGRLGYDTEAEEVFFGPELQVMFDEIGVGINTSFEYYLVDPGDFWVINLDGKYLYQFEGMPIAFGPLAGLAIEHFSAGQLDSTDIGINLGGSIEFPLEVVTPFVDLRYTITTANGRDNRFGFYGGLRYNFGG